MKRNKTKFARNIVYSLKRRYGEPGDLYHIVGTTDDTQTGVSVITKIKYKLKKIIVLPSTLNREIKSANIGAGNYPSEEIDTELQQIIIDKSDLPIGFEIEPNDYIITHSNVNPYNISNNYTKLKRFNIVKVNEFEDGISLIISGKFVKGGHNDEIIEMNINEDMAIIEETENE